MSHRIRSIWSMLLLGCHATAPPQQTSGSSAAPTTSAPTSRAAVTSEPERVVATKSLVLWLHIWGDHVFYLDTVDRAQGLEALVRMRADGRGSPEELLRGKFTRQLSADDHVLLFDRDGELYLAHGATKTLQTLGPASHATFRRGEVYVARPAGELPEVVLEAVPASDPAKPRRIGAIPRAGKLSGSVSAMLVTATDLYVAIDEDGTSVRTPCHIFRVPLAGGHEGDVATVTDLHDLHEVGGKVIVGSLAKAHVLDASGVLTPLADDTYWDVLATDGTDAYFAIATSLPAGAGIGGWLHAWTPPSSPRRIYEQLRDPGALGLSPTHVYWFDGKRSEILRLPRVAR